ncbi:MAG: hypothetical protein JWM32_514 [Verrucomicrobia bacterium]|nr:hypothetical protein [Verrucomicrobiota bacterium]
MESQIKAALISLLDGIKRSDGKIIALEMERLDDFLARGQADGSLHPQLEHFLEKRSYAKAVMFLGGETDIPVGACGGRPGKGGVRKSETGNEAKAP